MVRAFLITILLSTAVWANDIYVGQAEVNTQDKAALETKQATTGSTYQQPQGGNTFEKSLIVPTNSAQYCSVVAGCYTNQ
jgi:hypothetical protein